MTTQTLRTIAVAFVAAGAMIALFLAAQAGASLATIAGGVFVIGAACVVMVVMPAFGSWVLMAVALAALGAVTLVAFAGGVVPTSLMAFWGACNVVVGASVALMARGEQPPPHPGRVLAGGAAALALLGAALTGYAMLQWKPAERIALEELPVFDEVPVTEPVPGGDWAAYLTWDAADAAAALDDVGTRLADDGWQVEAGDGLTTIAATRSPYALTVIAEEGTEDTGTDSGGAVSLALHLGER